MRYLIAIPLVMLAGCNSSAVSPTVTETSYPVIVYTDTGTGCQYVTESRGLTPRIAADGHTHMGCKGVQK